MATRITEDVQMLGSLSVSGGITGQARSGLTEDALQAYPLPIENFRVWDAYGTLLPGTSANDDLGVTAGTFATGCPYITTGDVKALGTTTRYARTTFVLPPEYVAGATVQLQFAAGMLTTVAATSAVVDAEIYLIARDTLKAGSDLVTTSATSINSLTFGNKEFALNSSGLAPGDTLDIRVSIVVVDGATATAVIAALAAIEFEIDIKG